MFEELISAGIVSIIGLMLLITLPGEAPLKRLLSKHAISKLFYYYTTFYLIFSFILLFWTICNWGWKSVSFQSYTVIQKLEKRITKLLLLIILVIPCRYILRLMVIPSTTNKNNLLYDSTNNKLEPIIETNKRTFKSAHSRHKSVPLITYEKEKKQQIKVRDSIDMKDIKNFLFGNNTKNNNINTNKKVIRINKETPFQKLEHISTLYNVLKWNPLPLELFEISRIFQLFAKIRVHGQKNIPTNKPCLIIINHALGHGFDVPMIAYILRKYCNLPRVRVLVSPNHFNYPIWCDIIYYLGGVPRTYQITEKLMKNNENIIMFAAKKQKTSMIWDNKKHLYLDLVHKYDYVLIPAVCVSDDDVINMVYNIHEPNTNIYKKNNKKNKNNINQYNNNTDTDTDNDEEKQNYQSFKTVHGRFRRGYRKQYHLRFSEPIEVPKNDKRGHKTRKSQESKLDEDDDYNLFFEENESPQSSSKVQVRFSGLEYKNKFSYSISSESNSDIDNKYNEIDIDNYHHRKRRWSRELEVGLKNAVEDAMTDGISEMYKKLKSDPNSSLLKTMQKKMKSMSSNQYVASLKRDIRSNDSNDIPVNGAWVD
eukprot:129781_1